MSEHYQGEAERQPLVAQTRSPTGETRRAYNSTDSSGCGVTDSFDDQITAALKSSLKSGDWSETRGLRFGVIKRVAQLPEGRLSGVLSLLLVHFCSLFAHFSILGNLVLYLVGYVDVAQDLACVVALVWIGVSFVLPLLGGWLADTRLGRQRAILIGLLLYCIATGLLPLHAATVEGKDATGVVNASNISSSALDRRPVTRISVSAGGGLALLIIALVLCTFGSSLLWPIVPVFGADQFLLWSAGTLPLRSFFHWLFWMANLAAVVAFTGVAYVQQYISFIFGYLPAVIALVIATLVYLRALYQDVYFVDPPDRQAFGEGIGVIGEALQHVGRKHPTLRNKRHRWSWLDAAKIVHGGSFSSQAVEDVKAVFRLLPLFAVLIIYWTIFSQVRTTFLLQSMVLDLYRGSVKWSATTLASLDRMSLLVLLPLTDRVLYPFLTRRGWMPSPITRVAIGFSLAICAMVAAGFVEKERLKLSLANQTRWERWGHHGSLVLAADLSVFVQIPQYLSLAVSELLTFITVMELAYNKSSPATHGFVMGLMDAFRGLGSLVAAALLVIINAISQAATGHTWYPDSRDLFHRNSDYKHFGHADYYFFTLAVLMALNTLALTGIIQWYGNWLSDSPVPAVQVRYTNREQPYPTVRRTLVNRETSGSYGSSSRELTEENLTAVDSQRDRISGSRIA